MPNTARTASPVVLSLAAALAAATPASAAPDAVAPASPAAPALQAGGATITPTTALPTLPRSGRMVRVLDRQLRLATGSTVAVRARTTTVPVRVELRVGRFGRLIDRVTAAPNERFRLQGRARGGERLWLRVTRTDGGSDRSSIAIGAVSAMRPALASWYGPGLYGQRTACGQTLTTGLRGVAHKSLPCGTRIAIRYRGRSTTAVVVDRGPFSGAREFDLTAATARAIGFGAVGQVWVSHR